MNGNPADPRIDDSSGADLTPEWDLHLIDASVAMGNLVDVAASQSRAYCSRQRRRATRLLATRLQR